MKIFDLNLPILERGIWKTTFIRNPENSDAKIAFKTFLNDEVVVFGRVGVRAEFPTQEEAENLAGGGGE